MTFGKGQVNRMGGKLQAARLPKAQGVACAFVNAVACLAVVLAVACTPLYANHGFIPDEKDLLAVKTGVDTRDTVAAFLGRPSTEGLLGDTEWFYVQSRWKTVGARASVEIDRQVVAITFDAAGKVTNVERFGLEKGEIVAISRRITTEPIHGRSALAQIFSSIGRIDPASLLRN